MKKVIPLLLSIALYPTVGFSEEAKTDCVDVIISDINYTLMKNIPKEQSATDAYKQEVDKLTAFVKKYDVKDFKLNNEYVSVNAYSYSNPNNIELSINISFESAYDLTLIDKVKNEMQPLTLAFTRMTKCVKK